MHWQTLTFSKLKKILRDEIANEVNVYYFLHITNTVYFEIFHKAKQLSGKICRNAIRVWMSVTWFLPYLNRIPLDETKFQEPETFQRILREG